jgi:hypothetical protein
MVLRRFGGLDLRLESLIVILFFFAPFGAFDAGAFAAFFLPELVVFLRLILSETSVSFFAMFNATSDCASTLLFSSEISNGEFLLIRNNLLRIVFNFLGCSAVQNIPTSKSTVAITMALRIVCLV